MLRNLNRQFTLGRILGTPTCGVLGSAIPSTGANGAGYCYNDLSLPADADKNICGRITTWPTTGELFAYEDTSFVFTPAGTGVESFQYQLYVDGVAVGSPTTVMLYSGTPVTVSGIIGDAVAAGSTAELARTMAAAIGDAVAAGSVASVTIGITGAVGNVVAEGGLATITNGSATTITGITGDAVASGALASILQAYTLDAIVGNAAASGTTASISGALTITCTPGDAVAGGSAAYVGSIITVACGVGNASADGLLAEVRSALAISATIGNAVASGQTASVTYTSAAQGGAVAIMRALLVAHAPLTALVPAPRVFAGIIPQGALLPAISIQEISGAENSTLARLQATTQNRSRVQVTVVTKSLADQKRIISAAKLGPGIHRGTFASYKTLSVMPESVGPDMNNLDDDGIYEQSRDFMVTFVEAN